MRSVPPARFVLFAVALGFAAVFAPVPAQTGPYEDGLVAYYLGDYATALQLWRPLAEQGDADAQKGLGVMYHNGQGVLQDYAEAVKWYRLAAEQGNVVAQFSLGVMYHNGQGVPQDFVQSYMWLNLAASRSSRGEQRDSFTMSRDDLAARMTPEQIAEAQRLAREWKPK